MNRTPTNHLRLVRYADTASAVFPLSAPPQWSSRRLRHAADRKISVVKPLVLLGVAVLGIGALITISKL